MYFICAANMSTECVVCLDLMTTANASRLSCGHAFHTPCLQRWTAVSPTCPVCRAEVVTQQRETQRQRIAKLLHNARDPSLFKTCSLRARALLLHSEDIPCNSSYQIAHYYATKSEHCMQRMLRGRTPGDYDDWMEAVSNMLVHLHMAGDTRASRAAGERSINVHEAAAIARRLSHWVMPSRPPRRAVRYRAPWWRWLLCEGG
jgi:hypothetical protein